MQTKLCHTTQLAIVSLLFAFAANAQTTRPDAEKQLAREIYKEMIEVHSGFTTGSTTLRLLIIWISASVGRLPVDDPELMFAPVCVCVRACDV